MGKVQWTVDFPHSAIEFSVKHMMFATVRGVFHEYEPVVVADPEDMTTADIKFTIDAASIDTHDEKRNGHLRSADFFDVEKYPNITFTAGKITRSGDSQYKLSGDLTMHGVTRLVEFDVTFEGQGKDPWGKQRAAFTAQADINRKDFGLNWNAPLEAGGVLVSDQVKISVAIEAIAGE